ncbi:PREDICTED: uncharacterized protein LOC109225993 [Nicotiana attenuata]|uniref:uncharacterized protein LOC109225993 n=1 Tax=Nicotiana attenuata TaxID=49451 RepID=UPI0009058B51|nr:PREDICTED: uncharacterized protein LOC109225993 [Nicotiana attenuata]
MPSGSKPVARGLPSAVYIPCVVCRLLHSGEFTQCAQSAHHRVLTRRAEAVAEAVAAAALAVASHPYLSSLLSFFFSLTPSILCHTPTVLFVLLNVMIGTIAFTSSLVKRLIKQKPTKLTRSPSILQRIKSINFYNYRSQEPVKDYSFDHPHNQETTFEPQTHYIFEPAPEHSTVVPESTHYIFFSISILCWFF